jgi:hypothetical protein
MSFRLQSPASSTGRLGGDKPTAAGSPPPKAISGRHCRCSDEQWRRPATVSKKAAFAQPLALPSSLFLLSRPTQALPWTAGGELGDRRRGRSVLPGPGSDEPSPRSGRTGACRAASPPVRDFSVRAQAKPPPWLAPPLDPDPACLAPDPAAPAPVDADAVVVRRGDPASLVLDAAGATWRSLRPWRGHGSCCSLLLLSWWPARSLGAAPSGPRPAWDGRLAFARG